MFPAQAQADERPAYINRSRARELLAHARGNAAALAAPHPQNGQGVRASDQPDVSRHPLGSGREVAGAGMVRISARTHRWGLPDGPSHDAALRRCQPSVCLRGHKVIATTNTQKTVQVEWQPVRVRRVSRT